MADEAELRGVIEAQRKRIAQLERIVDRQDMEELTRRVDTIRAELWYPRCDDRKAKHVEIDLIDVRASDGLRVSYDFDRDGWVIEQPTVFQWGFGDAECDEGWTEVAFVESWGASSAKGTK